MSNTQEYKIEKDIVRKFAITALDDGHGINEEAMDMLSFILVETGNEDLLSHVDSTDGRFYIGEDNAEELLKDMLVS